MLYPTCSLASHIHSLFHDGHPQQSDTFVTIDKLMVIYNSHSKFIIYFMVYSLVWEKCVMKYINHKVSYRVFSPLLKSSQSFPGGSAGKESACNAADLGLIPWLGRSPGERKGYPLQSSGLRNSMDCIVHAITNIQT